MKENEYICVGSYVAETYEDSWERGEQPKASAFWNSKDVPVTGSFRSVEDALKAVCEANFLKWDKDAWQSFGRDCGEDFGRFDGCAMVDADNAEATASEVEDWKAGKKRLWALHLSVFLEVRTTRELTEEEALAF